MPQFDEPMRPPTNTASLKMCLVGSEMCIRDSARLGDELLGGLVQADQNPVRIIGPHIDLSLIHI